MLTFYSQLLENAVNEISKLPGIGKRTALRLALYLSKASEENVEALLSAIATSATTCPITRCVTFAIIPSAIRPSFVWCRISAM